MMGGGFGGDMGWGWIWPMLLVFGLAALLWGLWRARSSSQGESVSRGDRPRGVSHDRSREILRERYARGEITEEEMRERIRVLGER